MKEYYSVKEFAVLVGVHPNTVRSAIKYGRIQAFRVGRGITASYRISHGELYRMTVMDMRKIVEELAKEMNGKPRETE